jgi:hypothetical protein
MFTKLSISHSSCVIVKQTHASSHNNQSRIQQNSPLEIPHVFAETRILRRMCHPSHRGNTGNERHGFHDMSQIGKGGFYLRVGRLACKMGFIVSAESMRCADLN